MTELGAVLEQLQQERKRAEGELRQLQEVIAALSKITGHSRRSSRFGNRAKHRLSAAARERIAAAQRARWAKVRDKAKKSS